MFIRYVQNRKKIKGPTQDSLTRLRSPIYSQTIARVWDPYLQQDIDAIERVKGELCDLLPANTVTPLALVICYII